MKKYLLPLLLFACNEDKIVDKYGCLYTFADEDDASTYEVVGCYYSEEVDSSIFNKDAIYAWTDGNVITRQDQNGNELFSITCDCDSDKQ